MTCTFYMSYRTNTHRHQVKYQARRPEAQRCRGLRTFVNTAAAVHTAVNLSVRRKVCVVSGGRVNVSLGGACRCDDEPSIFRFLCVACLLGLRREKCRNITASASPRNTQPSLLRGLRQGYYRGSAGTRTSTLEAARLASWMYSSMLLVRCAHTEEHRAPH